MCINNCIHSSFLTQILLYCMMDYKLPSLTLLHKNDLPCIHISFILLYSALYFYFFSISHEYIVDLDNC